MFKWEIIGHTGNLKFLENSILKQRIANAYLFYGPQGVGKGLTAKQFSKILFCLNNENKPCGECAHCRQIENGIHPDFFKIKKEEDKNNITIEQVRDLRDKLSKGSFFGLYKIVVIEDAQYLNESSWNSLLKILEEAPLRTVIILIADQLDKIPLTIISRCQKLFFSLISQEQIYNFIDNEDKTRNMAADIARLSNGRPGLAFEIINDDEWMENYKLRMRNFLLLFDKNKKLNDKNKKIEEILKENENAEYVFSFLILLIRDLSLIKLAPDLMVNSLYKDDLEKLSYSMSLEKIAYLLEMIVEFKNYLANNVNPKLLLQNFILEIC